MFILIIGLSVNISLLNSNQTTSVTSHAASKDSDGTLPSLPPNCLYQTVNNKVEIVCPSPTPAPESEKHAVSHVPIAIDLPQLPATCHYQTSNTGYVVTCANPQTIIPQSPVVLPTKCTTNPNTTDQSVSCVDSTNNAVTVTLPDLPQGCTYIKSQAGIVIACSAVK